MRHWLVKTEPDECSIGDMKRTGVTRWDGVRNFAARKNLLSMKRGDRVLIHHSSIKEPAIVGIGRVAREAYEDPTQFDLKSAYYYKGTKNGKAPWVAVDISYELTFTQPITLSYIKKESLFKDMVLCHEPRLSVQMVEAKHFTKIKSLGSQATKPKLLS